VGSVICQARLGAQHILVGNRYCRDDIHDTPKENDDMSWKIDTAHRLDMEQKKRERVILASRTPRNQNTRDTDLAVASLTMGYGPLGPDQSVPPFAQLSLVKFFGTVQTVRRESKPSLFNKARPKRQCLLPFPVKHINDPNFFPAMPQIIIIENKVVNRVVNKVVSCESGETKKSRIILLHINKDDDSAGLYCQKDFPRSLRTLPKSRELPFVASGLRRFITVRISHYKLLAFCTNPTPLIATLQLSNSNPGPTSRFQNLWNPK